jgi:hypothetical protein
MIIIAVMTVCFLLSACTGVDKGIKILSNINMIVAILILLVVLFGGPTAYLFQSFIYAIGDYLIQLIPMSFKTYAYTPAGSWNWFHGWTLTYLGALLSAFLSPASVVAGPSVNLCFTLSAFPLSFLCCGLPLSEAQRFTSRCSAPVVLPIRCLPM